MFFPDLDQTEPTPETPPAPSEPVLWLPPPQEWYGQQASTGRTGRQRASRSRAATRQPPSDAQIRYLRVLGKKIIALHAKIVPILAELEEEPMTLLEAAGINPGENEYWPGTATWLTLADRREVSDLVDLFIRREIELKKQLRNLRAKRSRRNIKRG